MLPLPADRFDGMLVRLLIVWFNRLGTPPSSTRWVLKAVIAKSTAVVVNLDASSVPICGPVGFAGLIERWTTFPLYAQTHPVLP